MQSNEMMWIIYNIITVIVIVFWCRYYDNSNNENDEAVALEVQCTIESRENPIISRRLVEEFI